MAKGPGSSVGGVPVGYCPDEVHMEEEVQLKVQVEEEEMGETETDWHKQYRLGGYNFVVVAPLAELLMLRTCLEPFRHLLAAHLLLSGGGYIVPSGKGWRRTSTIQSVHCCKGLLGGGVLGHGAFEIFRWEALEVSTRPQAQCRCTTPHLQDPVSNGLRSARTLVLAPRAISTKLFLLLEDTDFGKVFVKTWQTKKCMLDGFSAAYIAKYKVAGFDDPEAKVVLQQVAQSMRMDIADIESRHASLRRMLKSVVHMLSKANMRQRWAVL